MASARSASTSRAARCRTSGPSRAGGNSFAWGVDVYGDVVGWAEDATDHNNAFVYAAGLGGMRRLGDLVDPALGWQLVQANAINAHGMIVGWGYHNGAPRGFKLALPVCVAPIVRPIAAASIHAACVIA